jgi:hypothetical protein
MKLNNGLSKVTDEASEEQEDISLARLWHLVVNEARAVSLWSCVSMMLRMGFVFLGMLATYREDSNIIHSYWNRPLSASTKELMLMFSVFCGWMLCLAPSKVITLQAPGFAFANPW